jgi:phosphoribosylformimino-5-aminoimidazole carboxamide ribotide isomerase
VLLSLDNDTSKLVIDLSCRRKDGTWFVAMNKWQTITEMEITKGERASSTHAFGFTDSM